MSGVEDAIRRAREAVERAGERACSRCAELERRLAWQAARIEELHRMLYEASKPKPKHPGGRPPIGAKAMTAAERQRRSRAKREALS